MELPFLEYSITTCCTLRCRDCSNLIPKIQPGRMLGFAEFKLRVDQLLACVDYIYRFKLHGGEPFLNPALPDMIDYLHRSEKIGEIRISTNGTLAPNAALLRALKNRKVLVFLSDYPPSVAPERGAILQTMTSAGVRVRDLRGQTWSDLGDTECRGYSPKQLRRLIRDCSMANCKAMADGCIYLCSRCANADVSGLFPVPEKVHIDSGDISGTRRAIRELYCIASCEGCGRCSGVIAEAPAIPPAIQIGSAENNTVTGVR